MTDPIRSPWAAPDTPEPAPSGRPPAASPGYFPGAGPPLPPPPPGFAGPRGPGGFPVGPRPVSAAPGQPVSAAARLGALPPYGGEGPWPGRPGYRPSGLFPATPRPTWREGYPAGAGAVAIGVLAGTVWMALLGVLGTTARSYVWWTIAAGLLGGWAAYALARFGDRGVAAGVALACGIGVAVSFVVVVVHWAGGHWLLW